uniref:Uncharacterized protein n=1 Tax=Arundo donax TaxID=35708 RepID=A0A0A9B2K3_ARUDO
MIWDNEFVGGKCTCNGDFRQANRTNVS